MKFKDYVDKPREKIMEMGVEVLSKVELLSVLLENGYKGVNVLELSSSLLKNKLKKWVNA